MKRSLIIAFLVLLFIGVGIYFFTPLGPKVRGYAGRLWSKSAVALKTDLQVSDAAYKWTVTGTDGNPRSFAKEKGEVVFLNFWATWCAPCLKEMPDIQDLYDDYGDKIGFFLVTQEDTSRVDSFLQKNDYTLPFYYTDIENIPEELASKSMPTTYILGKEGKIALAETGARDWNSAEVRAIIDRLLAE
ncbi:TlpA disulfide reductase family protein [Pricia sp. S334]|uniref:TlpA disulfide reductase family protein n=1 Tax=Pricia mediterranea TaxID=3076079 RepID=A0ABU3L901_9FLAO|nr:TlpA disulfide reductase family protein [Pricia sp. S334]MDT7829858.1 TlpA disulfide reductase family protein [Pricia sp. S334]